MIIGLTGMNGCGSRTVAKYLAEKHKFQFLSILDVLREEAKARKLDAKLSTLIKLVIDVRKKHGNSVLADRLMTKINPDKNYVIDLIRHPAEVFAFSKIPQFRLVAIKSSPSERFKRIKSYDKINLKTFLERDAITFYNPGHGQQVGICESMAQYSIMNTGTKNELFQKIEKMLEFFKGGSMRIKIKKVHPDAIIPRYEHDGDSGMDVCSVQSLILNPKERALVRTGLKFEIPKGYEIQVRPKSGLALKQGITHLNTPGTIDSNYRGELSVILINHSSKPFKIEKGKKVAQLVVSRVENAEFKIVEDINQTVRGEGGFGSTSLYYK